MSFKKPYLLVPLLLVAAVYAGAATLGEPVTLAVGESAELAELKLTFTGVDGDSRCPKEVQCIVMGQATVLLRVEAPGEPSSELRIAVPPDLEAEARAAGYVIAVDLEPEADADKAIDGDAYFVTLVVDRAADRRAYGRR